MVRHLVSTIALVVCAAVYALAGERATFILDNGERVGGELAVHGENGANFVDGQLKLVGGGTEQAYSIDRVAAIDFLGGMPSALELSRVPTSSAQAVVLRNGHAQAGKFVNIVRGDTLLWENDKGQEEQYPLRDVARIYLNSQAARSAFRSTGAATTVVGTSGQTPTQTPDQPGGVRVYANQRWTDSGVTVKVGDMVTFQTQGQIAFGQSSGQVAGADGKGDVRSPNYPVSAMPAGGLIAKVGTMAPFPIGANQQPIRMPANGRLMLGVNDDEVSDNGGYFSVVVRQTGQRR